jgi:hypothetical protein
VEQPFLEYGGRSLSQMSDTELRAVLVAIRYEQELRAALDDIRAAHQRPDGDILIVRSGAYRPGRADLT